MRFVFIFCLFMLLLGCNQQTSSTEMPVSNADSNHRIEINTAADKEIAESLFKQILEVNQLIEELDLLIIKLQKTDELPEAIEMMETATSEAKKILKDLKTLQTENKSLTEFKGMYEESLNEYTNGLKLQIDGMKNWDGQKITEGFKQTELAKNNLKQYHEKVKNQFK
ncbi:hypothetical protein M670_00372 [Schinkia azotoformans MEV2011]|uniref:Lipoprotein n=1 Tax=Schinkia azotoformans MEV2011 TaxID=1348973 RepID=A0A072NS93_SCHAZ|nr:hypothetical protein [Schinkia azotoformans]KEF40346.1 hypothetical protein M670_00372 [Schinkia azotoformans MEV2011]MEC1696237.1 hypothetical protein [Schinkia azotoformans]MEC1716547.1 hypothetical protein [Schinkia azotoformans]MEC1725259.1 hypothetical protein [Schinkia azotoformans]MEC1739385.1 hypothetical protein [Schinkia azotoformans]